MISAAEFVKELSQERFPSVFNPYSDICNVYDQPNAGEIRRRNLTAAITAALTSGVDSLWVARDLGHRGGRRTGLAMTDDVHIQAHASLCGALGLQRATLGDPVAEATARVIWRSLKSINRRVFLWNVFPLHPHQTGDGFTNRAHKRHERDMCGRYLDWLLEEMRPTRVIAIGNDAASALSERGIKCSCVRHPSYGGQNIFLRQVGELYGAKGL
jgi:hypothetical protein